MNAICMESISKFVVVLCERTSDCPATVFPDWTVYLVTMIMHIIRICATVLPNYCFTSEIIAKLNDDE